jgi:hypothetical protein
VVMYKRATLPGAKYLKNVKPLRRLHGRLCDEQKTWRVVSDAIRTPDIYH